MIRCGLTVVLKCCSQLVQTAPSSPLLGPQGTSCSQHLVLSNANLGLALPPPAAKLCMQRAADATHIPCKHLLPPEAEQSSIMHQLCCRPCSPQAALSSLSKEWLVGHPVQRQAEPVSCLTCACSGQALPLAVALWSTQAFIQAEHKMQLALYSTSMLPQPGSAMAAKAG